MDGERRSDKVMNAGWRERLLAAVDADGRSDRQISLAAGLGPSFVNELRNQAKDPQVHNVSHLADELHVSLTTLLTGLNITSEEEEILRLLRSTSHAQREALIVLLGARQLHDRHIATSDRVETPPRLIGCDAGRATARARPRRS
jgi:hypothetical protein